ncbi:MAG: RNA polymerase sigma factor [Opitutaceae bacterium]
MTSPAADPTAAAEDRLLMERVRAGDEAAFAALMERWERPVKSVVARMVLNAAEAEELAQEAFVRLWQRREDFRPGAEFRPWLLAIAVNLARNRRRWWRRRPSVELGAWLESGGDAGEMSGGAGALERAERVAAVQAAVAALPNELREALVLFEFEELPQSEVAAVLGTTSKAVESRVARAREKLRRALQRNHLSP